MSGKDYTQQSDDYRRIEKAICFAGEHFKDQPSLDEIADHVHLSKYHFHRLFKRWAGISPARFMQFLTLEYAKSKLNQAQSVLGTAFDAGLSGPGRLHDLFVNFEAMTPGEFKKMGEGLIIEYGFHSSPFGLCILAVTDRGICHLSFVNEEDRLGAIQSIQECWPMAAFVENPLHTGSLVKHIFNTSHTRRSHPFQILIKGTNFQVNVWKALLKIPVGSMVSYQNIVVYIGRPKAFRAVANTIAINPVAYLIPCHRVIAKTGKIHQYRWGETRKKAILGWEAAAGVK